MAELTRVGSGPRPAIRLRAALRAVTYMALVTVAAVALAGYMLATISIAVDHRRWIGWWIAATFTAAAAIAAACWVADRLAERRSAR